MKSLNVIFRIAVFIFAVCFSAPVQAHDTLLVMDNYQSSINSTPGLKVFSTHHFLPPEDALMGPDRLAEVFFITPSFERVAQKAKLSVPGTYMCLAVPVNGFATKTPDGYQRGKNKKEVDHPVLCRYSMKYAKAIFTVGRAGGDAYAKPLGQEMEIIPLKDPATLKPGDTLPVKVLKEGEPARTYVYGTYDAFSDKKDTFCYTTRTDKQGIAEIKLINDGTWVLIAKIEEPFADSAVCDIQRWAATLTFHVGE
jgi:hypothetical protein